MREGKNPSLSLKLLVNIPFSMNSLFIALSYHSVNSQNSENFEELAIDMSYELQIL